MMQANSTIAGRAEDDAAEAAYRNQRKVVRRRQLAVVLAVGCIATAYLGWRVARHLSAAWWLETNQFVVTWGIDKDNWKQGGSTTVRFTSPMFSLFAGDRPAVDLKFLTNLHRLEELNLSTLSGIRDADLAILDDLRSLRRLQIDRTNQPDWIKSSTKGLSDETLARIGRLSKLEELTLRAQDITDSGLASLAGLQRLQSLDLAETPITDAGLEHLKTLKALKTLDLKGTKASARGVAELESALPSLRVLSDPPPPAPRSKKP